MFLPKTALSREEFDKLREDGVGELFLEMGKMTGEEKGRLMAKFEEMAY